MSHIAISSLGANRGPLAGQAHPEPRLLKAAHEFEASMMQELLAPLEPGQSSWGDEEGGSGSTSALGSYAAEALGKALSEHGGIGIATSILHRLSAAGNHSGNSPVPEKESRNATHGSLQ